MSDSDDDVLARELGKIGERGAKLGELLSGQPEVGKAGALGGSIGAQFAAKLLPTESYSQKLALNISQERALKLGYSVLTKLGQLQTDDNKPPYPLLKAIIQSGFLNMNPTVVYLEILDGDSQRCEVTITGAAKEGLIKQQTAEKAVRRVASALSSLANEA
jgi:hypothetical protein